MTTRDFVNEAPGLSFHKPEHGKDLEEIYDTERQLLYVACTKARDRLFVSGVAPVSELLDDLEPSSGVAEAGVQA